MKLLIFDTETTGLPKLRESANVSPNNWPHLVSISWVILDSVTNQIEKKENFIVYPEKWVIPEEASNIHGITQEKALKEGEPLESIMMCFLYDQYDILVAHNLEFDLNVLIQTLKWDLNISSFDGTSFPKKCCTMNLSRNICKLPFKNGGKGYKSPKLKELYEFVFKKQPNENLLHSSSYDTEILTEIVQNCNELRVEMGLPVIGTLQHNGIRTTTLSLRLT